MTLTMKFAVEQLVLPAVIAYHIMDHDALAMNAQS